MSTPARATPRRTTRSSAAASPTKEGISSPVPASHPIKEESVEPSPRTRSRSNGKKAGAAASASSGGGGGTSIAFLLLAALVVAGGVLYTKYVQPQPAGSGAADVPAEPVQARRELEQQNEPEQAPLPLVEFTREEKAVFEQACEEHYTQPPSAPLPAGGQAAEGEADAIAEAVMGEEQDYAAEAEGEAYGEAAEAEGEGEAAAEEGEVPDPERDTGAHAEDSFNPEVHAGYEALPPWPEATEEELTGSWKLTEDIYNYAASLPMTQVLSQESPRVMLLPSFLTPAEVDHMIKISRDNLERSEVLVAEGDESVNDIRTSFGFWPESDEVIQRITERIHRTIGIPEKFGEGLYVLNYQNGQKYEAHNDHCMDGPQGTGNKADAACLDFLRRAGGPECGHGKGGVTCGDRVATFILYLKSPIKGGQTAFPEAQMTKDAMGAEHRPGNSPDEWYCEDERALSTAPSAGTGVLFWDYRPGTGSGIGSYEDGSARAEAQTVYEAMHAGCPVWEGEKYIATRWIRASGFDYKLERNAYTQPLAAPAA